MRAPLLLLGLAAVLSLAGCTRRESPAEEGRRTHTLHIGNYAEPRDLDPHVVVAYSDYNILIALFEGLTVIDEATSEARPGIAESWDISPDGLTYVFHLRNALWSDGAPVTAEDFAFSIQRILTPKLASEYSYMLYPLKGAEEFNLGKTTDFSTVGVQVIDPKTLKLTLGRPTPYFLTLLGHQAWYPVQKAAVLKHGDPFIRSNGWTKPGEFVGNGAFVPESWIQDQRLVVKKNPKYWNAAANRLERVVFYPIASPQVEEVNFRSGLLHITYEVLPDRIDAYRREHPEQVRVDPSLETLFIRFNVTKPVLNDKRVRQALARAIDRETIASAVLRHSKFPANSLIPPNTAGYNSPYKIPSDFAAARRLLAEAGYPDGRGFPRFEIQMNTDPANMLIFEAVQQMWRKELGIEVSLAQLENRVYLDNQHSLAYEINRSRWVADYNDPSTFTDLFLSNSGNNDTGWKNADYDRLVDAASREPDRAKRFELLGRAETLLLDEAVIAPIYFGTRTFLIRPEVKGWVPSLLGIHRYQTVWLE
ncbi:peptide ABC transporter substrate-binding protein [Opitutaceae bacterium EW11]|nr:peptide ABC transporter substrate-binding protein [Opitutaceae bacterium EW11]